MLIPSDRHTAADLELWKELEAADLRRDVCVMTPMLLLNEFTKRPCYCSVSWGKDSVCIASFIGLYYPQVPLVWVRPEGAEMPGCEEVRDVFLKRFPKLVYHEPVCPAEIWHDESVSNQTAFRPAVDAVGTTRRIVGVRADESGKRKLSMRHHGQATEQVCRPIGWLKVDDVFALLAQQRMPVHPAYAMLGGGRYDRRHLRVDSLGGPWADSFGRNEWEQEYFQDVINRRAYCASQSNR